jgi:hypothetical protein
VSEDEVLRSRPWLAFVHEFLAATPRRRDAVLFVCDVIGGFIGVASGADADGRHPKGESDVAARP